MSKFEDLTSYSYFGYFEGIKNVGWLDGEFPQASASKEFIDKLKVYGEQKFIVRRTRGWHSCPYCPAGKKPASSTSEIRVVGEKGEVYASPFMIIHYMEAHDYCPPQEFWEAVMHGPEPGSEKYKAAIKNAEKTYDATKAEEIRTRRNKESWDKLEADMVGQIAKDIDSHIIKEIQKNNERKIK